MVMLAIITLAFAPGIFWLWYFYHRDVLEHEPKSLVVRLFIYGMLVGLPIGLAEALFAFNPLILIVFAAPVIEEYFKYAVVRKSAYSRREFNEPMDGIVYACAVGLGFASLENTGYIVKALTDGNLGVVFVMRALLTVPAHAIFTSMPGYALGIVKFYRNRIPEHMVGRGLLLAMFLHSLFNFLAITRIFFAVGMLIFIPMIWVLINRRIKSALAVSPFGHEDGGEGGY